MRESYPGGYDPDPDDPIGLMAVIMALVILAYIVGACLTS